MENKEILKIFNEECNKFETYEKLYTDEDFEISSSPETKDQKQYNDIVDNADIIYSNILKYGKMIANNPDLIEEMGLSKSELEVKIHNMGVSKEDIDDEKEFSEEKIYPVMEKVNPILDKDLNKFLYE